jgi:hypothetical protein
MATLAMMMGPVRDGWAVFLTNGREVARFRGLGAGRRALRFLVRARNDQVQDRVRRGCRLPAPACMCPLSRCLPVRWR